MDTVKTGSFIRDARKAQGMTQQELARQLHITPQAVSKWERGACAPDIALLEPLAALLNCTIPELISGERAAERDQATETTAKNVLTYSIRELTRKVRLAKQRYLGTAAVCLACLLVVCALFLWRSGYGFVIDRNPSPDGAKEITVYSKALDGGGFSWEDSVSLIVDHGDGAEWRVTYGACKYLGSWWAPDSQKYVLALEYEDGVHLALAWLERNSESNLSAYLSMGVAASELRQYGYVTEDGWPEIEYRFLQWGLDSASMLIYYAFEDQEGDLHDGYFWYNCLDGTVEAVLELQP